MTKQKQQTKHYFFLNHYKDSSFTKCPRCNKKTKLRKFPLVIHIEPNQFLVLNKICKYCTECDLIITKQLEIETLMAGRFEKVVPSVVGNKYVVFGTLDKNQWLKYSKTPTDPREVVNQAYIFKDVLKFELAPRGWYKDESLKKQ